MVHQLATLTLIFKWPIVKTRNSKVIALYSLRKFQRLLD